MNEEPDAKRKRGRPTIPKSDRRIEVKAMLPPVLVAKAKAVAKARGISYSEFVEEALTGLLFQEFLNEPGPVSAANLASLPPSQESPRKKQA